MDRKLETERQFARRVRSSLSTVQDRRKKGLLPRSAKKGDKGRWWIDPSIGALEWEASQPVRSEMVGGGSLEAYRAARARNEAAKAELSEIDLRVRKGELVEVAGVQAAWANIVTQSRNKLMGIPTRVRQRCPHFTLADLRAIEDEIREALEDLAAGGSRDGK